VRHSEVTDYRVWVIPDDGQDAFDSTLPAWGRALADWGSMIVGCSVYVSYDPAKPDRCELDKDWYASIKDTVWPQGVERDQAVLAQAREREQAAREANLPPGAQSPPATAEEWRRRSEEMQQAAHERQQAALQARGASLAARDATASQAARASQQSLEERLKTLDGLHQSGVLSDDEYRTKRQAIIDSV
jgi:hypothetical protein